MKLFWVYLFEIKESNKLVFNLCIYEIHTDSRGYPRLSEFYEKLPVQYLTFSFTFSKWCYGDKYINTS